MMCVRFPGVSNAMSYIYHRLQNGLFEMKERGTDTHTPTPSQTRKKSYLTQISHKIIYERMLLTVYRTRIRAKYCKQGRVCVPSWKSAHRYDLHNIFYELYVFAQYNPIDSIQYS